MSSFCKKCGTEIKEGALFCPKCGWKIGDSGTQNDEKVAASQSIPAKSEGNGFALNAVLGLLVVVLIGVGAFFFAFDGDVNKAKSVLPSNEQTKVETVADNAKTGDAGAENKPATQDDKIADFVSEKDKLDVEIAGVASEVNNYLKGHSDFRGSDAEKLIGDAKKTLDKVEKAQGDLKQLAVKTENQAVKEALLRVLDCEAGRIRGLYKGMLDSKNNGDYMTGFKEGTENAYKYDDENAKFNSLYKK